MKRVLFVLAIALAGCRSNAQVPPSSAPVMNLTWTNNCTAPCAFVISRAVVTGTACPSNTGTSYAPLNQSAPVAATYSDPSIVAGVKYCYIAQGVDNASGKIGLPSLPSNSGVPLLVTDLRPLAPSSPSAQETQADVVKPSVTGNDSPVIVARLEWRRR